MTQDSAISSIERGVTAPLSVTSASLSLAEPGDYFALLKPRVMSLVIFTTFVGMVAAPGPISSWPLALLSLIAIALGAGASAAFNMAYDADIDRVMDRTKKRPIPQGKITANNATVFGGVLSLLSVWLLALTSNYLAAALLAGTIGFYAVIYSVFLKRRTPQNIVIGGAAGALPPVVGWAAVTGTAPLEAWLLFALVFLWTPPHFWALALVRSEDYARAGIPMLPNVAGAKATRNQIWLYSLVLVVVALVPVATPMAGSIYGVTALIMGGLFLRAAYPVWRTGDDKSCRSLFGFSILYLFSLFLALLVEHVGGFHG